MCRLHPAQLAPASMVKHQKGCELENIAPPADCRHSHTYSRYPIHHTAKPILKDQCFDYEAGAMARQALCLTGVFDDDTSADELDSYERFDRLMLAKSICRGFHELNTSLNEKSVPDTKAGPVQVQRQHRTWNGRISKRNGSQKVQRCYFTQNAGPKRGRLRPCQEKQTDIKVGDCIVVKG